MPDPKDRDRHGKARDEEPKDELTSPGDLPSPEVDPAAERDEPPPGDAPGDLDDGPLLAANANLPAQT